MSEVNTLYRMPVDKMVETTVRRYGRCIPSFMSDMTRSTTHSTQTICLFAFLSFSPMPLWFSPAWQSFMTCQVNTDAEIEAKFPRTSVPPFLLNDKQPPPFQCRPGKDPAGYWDESTGKIVADDTSFSNSNGRSDIEGCSMWGRGALLTRGSVSTPGYLNLVFVLSNISLAQS